MTITALVLPLAFGSVHVQHTPELARTVDDTYRLIASLGDLSESSSDDEISPQLADALRDGPDLSESATAADPWEDTLYDPLRDIGHGIPGPVLDAYLRADRTLARTMPKCGLHWSYLAGIGKVESNHARGHVDANGTTRTRILGPVLSGGPGVAAIADTDGGRLDGDPVWDRAVGPMQFIPSTWARYGVDGNGDGIADPHNIYDAALSAGRYLCSGGLDLRIPEQLALAVFRYNHSNAYVSKVLSLAVAYSLGISPLPELPPLVQRVRPAAPPPPAPTTTGAPPTTSGAPPEPSPTPLPPCPTSTTSAVRRPTTTTTTPPSTTTEPTTTTVPCEPPETSSTTTSPTRPGRPGRRPTVTPPTTAPSSPPEPTSTEPTTSSSPDRGSTSRRFSRSRTATPETS